MTEYTVDTEALQAAFTELGKNLKQACDELVQILIEMGKHCAELIKAWEEYLLKHPNEPYAALIGYDIVSTHHGHWRWQAWLRAWLDKYIFRHKSPPALFKTGDEYMWDLMRRSVKQADSSTVKNEN